MGIGIMIGHMVAVPLVQVGVPVATYDATCTEALGPAFVVLLLNSWITASLVSLFSDIQHVVDPLACMIVTMIFFCIRVWNWPTIYFMAGCILLLGSCWTRMKCAIP